MKLRWVLYISISLILLLIGYSVYYSLYKPVNNSTTISAKVIDKIHSKDKYIIEVVDVNDKSKSGKVFVKEENVWNLIDKKREYFMVLNFKSNKMGAPLFREGTTILQQIDIVK